MELAVLLLSLVVLLGLGVPVAFALLGATLATFMVMDLPLIGVFQRMAGGMSVFSLLAIPFFIFAGELMNKSGIAARLVQVCEAAFGRSRGGLGQVSVGASMLFGAVSGSAIASVSAMGSTLMPMMKERGYDADYAVNVSSTAAICGLLIPPSHNMIIYAAAAGVGVSIGELFVAGIVPGILTGAALMVAAWAVALKRDYPRGVFPGWLEFLKAFIMAIPGLITAVIIVGGVLGGLFTATESSAIAVIYTIVIGFLVYRTLGPKEVFEAAYKAAKTTAMVLLIIGAASAFGWTLALLEAPTQLAAMITGLTDNPLLILLIINLILLLLGTFMDMSPLIVITTPIFLPIAASLGVDPVQFGVILMLNLGIGLVTPPVGSVLFVGSAIGNVPVEQTVRTIWPFYLALLVALMGVTFVPAFSMGLVELMR